MRLGLGSRPNVKKRGKIVRCSTQWEVIAITVNLALQRETFLYPHHTTHLYRLLFGHVFPSQRWTCRPSHRRWGFNVVYVGRVWMIRKTLRFSSRFYGKRSRLQDRSCTAILFRWTQTVGSFCRRSVCKDTWCAGTVTGNGRPITAHVRSVAEL